MGFMQKLHKKASRLSFFDIDRPISVCDGITTSTLTSSTTLDHTHTTTKTLDAEVAPVSSSSPSFTSSPAPTAPPASPGSTPVSPTQQQTAAAAASVPPATFEKLQPVEYIAPRPRRSRSLGFDTLRRRMSILVASPTVPASPLPGCPGSPRLGPHGVLVTNGFFDADGNPVPFHDYDYENSRSRSYSHGHDLNNHRFSRGNDYDIRAHRFSFAGGDAPVPTRVVPEHQPRRRPMSNFLTSLPPGAAEPVLGGIVFDANHATETLDDETLFTPPRSFLRSNRSNSMSAADVFDDFSPPKASFSASSSYSTTSSRASFSAASKPKFTTTPDDMPGPRPRRREQPASPSRSPFARLSGVFSGAGHHAFSRGHNNNMSCAPAVPPRSHLRGVPSSTPSATSSAPSTADNSPVTSGRSSPTTTSSSCQPRTFVLEVAPPIPDLSKDLPISPRDPEDDVITFGRVNRRPKAAANNKPQSFDRDPYKIRDGAEAHKARSGVYTPKSFPGPAGPSASVNTSASASTSSAARSSINSAVRGRTVSGFKRLSSAFAHHSHATGNSATIQQPPPPLPTPRAVSSPVLITQVPPVTPIYGSATHLRQGSHASVHSHRSSHTSQRGSTSSSPSSSHSTRSISPPGTPTTPTSAHNSCGSFAQHVPNLHSVQAARPVVIVPADVAPDFGRPAEIDLESTPKPSPAAGSNGLPALSTDLPSPQPPFTSSPTQLSPTVPKRARRKPVPRLDDDLIAA